MLPWCVPNAVSWGPHLYSVLSLSCVRQSAPPFPASLCPLLPASLCSAVQADRCTPCVRAVCYALLWRAGITDTPTATVLPTATTVPTVTPSRTPTPSSMPTQTVSPTPTPTPTMSKLLCDEVNVTVGAVIGNYFTTIHPTFPVVSCTSPCGQGCRANEDWVNAVDTFATTVVNEYELYVERTDTQAEWGMDLAIPCCRGVPVGCKAEGNAGVVVRACARGRATRDADGPFPAVGRGGPPPRAPDRPPPCATRRHGRSRWGNISCALLPLLCSKPVGLIVRILGSAEGKNVAGIAVSRSLRVSRRHPPVFLDLVSRILRVGNK